MRSATTERAMFKSYKARMIWGDILAIVLIVSGVSLSAAAIMGVWS